MVWWGRSGETPGRRGGRLEGQVVGQGARGTGSWGGGLDKEVVGAGARGTGRWGEGLKKRGGGVLEVVKEGGVVVGAEGD